MTDQILFVKYFLFDIIIRGSEFVPVEITFCLEFCMNNCASCARAATCPQASRGQLCPDFRQECRPGAVEANKKKLEGGNRRGRDGHYRPTGR